MAWLEQRVDDTDPEPLPVQLIGSQIIYTRLSPEWNSFSVDDLLRKVLDPGVAEKVAPFDSCLAQSNIVDTK
jgi:hypothetical protein